jgi:hypothetical protein
MFKSKFASALSTMMVARIGLAAASTSWPSATAARRARWTRACEALVERYCRDALILARNRESPGGAARARASPRATGTDTAWTFDAGAPEVGAQLLRDAGWDGVTPVLVAVPHQPLLVAGEAQRHARRGERRQRHVPGRALRQRLLPPRGRDVHERQERYLDALAEGVRRFRQEHDVFPVMIGSEMLDREACEGLRDRLGAEW